MTACGLRALHITRRLSSLGGAQQGGGCVQRRHVIFRSDESEVIAVEGGFLWLWWEPEPREEFIPETGAAEYFRGSGREDIAAAVEAWQERRSTA